MMNMKKLLALLLAIVMVVGMFPMGVLAEETDPSVPETTTAAQETTVPETTAAANTEEEDNKGGLLDKIVEGAKNILIGGDSGDTTTPTGNTNPTGNTEPIGNTNPTETTGTATEPTTAPAEGKTVCGNCGGEHKTEDCKACVFCKNETCTCVTCDECGVKNDHTSTCSKNACADCGKNPCECKADETTAPTETTSPTEETTVPTTEGVEVCEHCGVELVEGAEHKEDCLSLCTCERVNGVHQEGCALYKEPEVVTLTVDVDGVSIAIAGDIPEDVKLSAVYVPEQVKFKLFSSKKTPQFNPAVYDLIGEDDEVRFCFDITPLDADGNVWQPEEGETVTVTMDVTPFEIEDGTILGIIHDHECALSDLGEYTVSDGKISFEMTGFSMIYAVSGEAALAADTSTFTEGMTQIFNIEDRVFYLILNRNYYGVSESQPTPDYTNAKSVFGRVTVSEENAKATKELNISNLTKWQFVPTGTAGEFFVKSVASGKYMKFNEYGVAALVDSGVPTKVYGYTYEGENDKKETTYLTLYTFVQTDANGAPYVLNQLGGTSYNGFCGYTCPEEYWKDVGQMFLMKEAYYEAESDIRVVPNSTTMDAVIKVFNYDSSINNYNAPSNGNEFQFYQGTGYGSRMSFAPDQVTVDGTYTGTTQMATMKPVLNASGYPESTEFGSFEYLFKEGTKYHKGTMNNGGYLFQRKNNYYVYDSINNAAWYDKDNNKFVLYNFALSPSYTQTHYLDINALTTSATGEVIGATTGIEASANDTQSGNFLPFNAIDTDTVYNEGTKQATGVPRYSLRTNVKNDMWFGLTTEFDFYMPENGQKNNEPMIFDFTGDDDVWVYIDDVLILDIGGTHGAYNGSINFATGDVKYTNSKNTTGVTTNLKAIYQAVANNTSVDATVKAKIQNILDNGFDGNTFKDFTKHSFNFYYLERGGNISYCRLKYNMDPLPKGALSVEKKTEDVNTVFNNGEYEFTISGKDSSGDDIETFTYKIVNKIGASEDTEYRTNNGKFTLKDGQVAVFTNIEGGNKITVKESQTLNYSTVCTVTGSSNHTGVDSTGELNFASGDSHFEVVFTNTIHSHDLNVKKVLDNPENAPHKDDVPYSFKVTINNAPYTGVVEIDGVNSNANAEGIFTMLHTQNAVIRDIPEGLNYVVEEEMPDDTDAYSYDKPVYDNASGTLDADKTVTITNTIRLRYADLTINKTGIDPLDHHPADASGKEERQSTVYTITGTTSAGVTIEPIEVVIYGNTSVTIQSLPIGEYTVTENTDWSWRYGVDTITAEKDTNEVVEGNSVTFDLTWEDETVNYKNKRSKVKWLSGDCYCENNWGTTTGLKSN